MVSCRLSLPRYILVMCTLCLVLGGMWAGFGRVGTRGKIVLAAAPSLSEQSQNQRPSRESRIQVAENYGRLPLSFEENRGQTERQVKFVSRGRGYALFLTSREAVLSLSSPEKSSVMRMKLVGANPLPDISGVDQLPGSSNYYFGDDAKQWHTDVPNFAKVKYQQTYPGIDLVYYGNQQSLEYDFIVAPGANPHAITLDLAMDSATDNHSSLHVDANGDLVVNNSNPELRFRKPVLYQTTEPTADGSSSAMDSKNPIDGRWVLKGGSRVGFEVASYDATKPLVIDPALSYATYLGGSLGDVAQAIAVDSSGNAYVTGDVNSTDFPTMNPAQGVNAGHGDAFVAKLNPTGTALLYSTYLGGAGLDGGFGIAVDASGNAYVGGDTGSKNFPVTKGVFQPKCGGGCTNGTSDIFVTKLNPSGALVYSTYMGGSGTDRLVEGIAVDSAGHAYVTGWTTSADFPTTAGAFQTTMPGPSTGFVAEINAAGSGLIYSTYLGGNNTGVVSAIALDSSNDAYVTGWTTSTNFPTTAGAFQNTLSGGMDTFVAVLNPTGSGLVYSTYVGGSADEISYGIAANSSGDAYIVGYTCSANFPITPGAFKTTYTSKACTTWGGNGFATEVAAGGGSLVYSTYLGGSGSDVAFNLVLDNAGVAYITGRSQSSNFPVTAGAFQTKLNGGIDAFVTELNPTGTGLIYSTYLGGSLSDAGYVIALDPAGNAYVAGRSYSTNFPTTPGSFQATLPGTFSSIIFKIAPGDQAWPLALNFGGVQLGATSAAMTTLVSNSETVPLNITSMNISGPNASEFAQSGSTCGNSLPPGQSCTVSVTFSPQAFGARSATLSITDSAANSPQTVALAGSGSPIALAPTSLTFATQLIGTTSASQPASVTNNGSSAVTVTKIAATGPFSQTNNCTLLSPGASCTLNVVFSPASSGMLKGSLTITETDPGGTQTLALTGTGTVMSPTPTSLAFAPQTLKTSSAPQPFTVTNLGAAAVTINKISVGGMRASSFTQTNNCPIAPATLASQASCTINVTFTPQLKGALTAMVQVFDTGGGSPQNVPLTGTGN